MDAEMIGRIASGGITIAIAIFFLLVASGTIKIIKDPEKLAKFRWIFWLGGVLGIILGLARIFAFTAA